jgi:tRNA pseudouridine55 synthase
MNHRVPFGFFNIDKPHNITSHDVVAQIRRKLRIKKVGHAGTLDPLATGVLVVCLGDATRLSEYVMATKKVYEAQIRLGVETTTYDAEGKITEQHDVSSITRQHIEQVLPRFRGVIDQLPPAFSAIKKDGRKLYQLARSGQHVEREPRQVEIFELGFIDWQSPTLTLRVECGPGTYIRSLAHDIGVDLRVGGHLTGLRRTQSGNFSIQDAIPLNALLGADQPEDLIVPPDEALQHMPAIELDASQVEAVFQGRPVDYAMNSSELGRGYAPDGRLIAILRPDGKLTRPHKVFVTQFNVPKSMN